MNYILINAIPILAAALAAGVFAAAWYRLVEPGPVATDEGGARRRWSPGLLLLVFLCEAWMAAILAGALILAPVEAGRWTVALGSAGIIWVGFVLPVIAATYRLRQLSWGAVLGDATHWLGAMLLMAAVLRLLGVEAPVPPG